MAKKKQRGVANPTPIRKAPKAVEIRASALTADIASADGAWATLAKLTRENPLTVLVGASDAPDGKCALAIASALGDRLPQARFACEDGQTERRMLHARRVADQILADQMFARDRRANPKAL